MASSENPLRLAVIGLGGWGKNVLRAFAQVKGTEVAAICDRSAGALEAGAKSCPGARKTSNFEEVLGDPSLAAVVLATPAVLHGDMAKAALEAGKHVYVEKPMCLNTATAKLLVDLAESRNLRLMVGHLLEYHPAVDLLKKLVDGGTLGDIYYMYSERVNLGVVRQDENALWSLAPHDISVVMYLFGTQPRSVSAQGSCHLRPGIEDVVFLNMTFADGRMAQVHVSWLDPHKERRMVLVGSKCMAVFDDMSPNEKVRIYDKGADVRYGAGSAIEAIMVRHGEIRIPLVANTEPLNIEAQHFVDCIREGRRPRSDGRDGLRVVSVLEAASRSMAMEGAPVKVVEL